jgi:hypothetical protein
MVPLQFPLSPKCILARRVEHSLDVALQRYASPDLRHHCRAVLFHQQDQAFHRCLPFSGAATTDMSIKMSEAIRRAAHWPFLACPVERPFMKAAGLFRRAGMTDMTNMTDFPLRRPISAPYLWWSLRDRRLAVGSALAPSIPVCRSVPDSAQHG